MVLVPIPTPCFKAIPLKVLRCLIRQWRVIAMTIMPACTPIPFGMPMEMDGAMPQIRFYNAYPSGR